MQSPRYPSLYQINSRVWLTGLSRTLDRSATLDDIPDAELDRLAEMGFDWIWFLSVWQTGSASRKISRSNPEWRKEFESTLPDLSDEDIPDSGFAIAGYIFCSGRLCATGDGNWSNVSRPSTAMDHATISSPAPGRSRAACACSSPLIIPLITAGATSGYRFLTLAAAGGRCRTCLAMLVTNAMGMTYNQEVFI